MYMCGRKTYTCQTTCFVTGSMISYFFFFSETSCTMGTESFLGVKRLGRGANHPPFSSVVFANGLEFYRRLFSVPAQLCYRVTFTCNDDLIFYTPWM
jgi:hypothetical protein